MCQIAGYAGTRRAAPILVEMLRRQEFIDGGAETGIATISDGKIHMRKVAGCLDVLLRETDALDLPGTVGFIHSRPSGTDAEFAHPFLSSDHCTAVIENGITAQTATPELIERRNRTMAKYFERGDLISSALPPQENVRFCLPDGRRYHYIEMYAHFINELVEQQHKSVSEALSIAMDEYPIDTVIGVLQVSEPDAITVGKITRPCSVGIGNGEIFFSTFALAFPEDAGKLNVFHLPTATVAKIRANKLSIYPYTFRNFNVENISPKAQACAYRYQEKILSEADEAHALSIDDLSIRKFWREMWTEPLIDCKYSTGEGMLKPYVCVTYENLYQFYKEGRLRSVVCREEGKRPTRKFWIA